MGSNLDFVRSTCAAWERGDFSSADWAHPEIEYVVADGAEPGRWTGLAGMAEAWRSRLSAWEDVRLELKEYRELDEERVLVFYQPKARGKASGLDVAQLRATGAIVFYVRGEKVTRFVQYNDSECALNDLGLPSETIPLDFPRFRRHLNAEVERPGEGGSSAENQAAVSGGVQA